MKNLNTLMLVIFLGINLSFGQTNDCLPLLKDGLYKHVLKTETSSFNKDLKTYFESQTFKDDFKSGKWNLGVDGVTPVGKTGLMQEISLDFGASENDINKFQELIKQAEDIQINQKFYNSTVTAVPDIGLAQAYVKCVGINKKIGFFVDDIIETPENVIFNISYRKRLSSDPMPTVKNFKIIGSTKIIQGLNDGQKIPDQISISCERYPENEIVLSINTDRENLVYVVERSDIGFEKEFPIGSILTSVLDWNSFSQITEDKPSSAWDAEKSKWAPADGRSVASSKYQRKTGKLYLPDLRGVFLRGLNRFDPFYANEVSEQQKDPDGGNRTAGTYQSDAIKEHQHSYTDTYRYGNVSKRSGSQSEVPRDGRTETKKTNYNDDSKKETRPKNIAVYYYIRIN